MSAQRGMPVCDPNGKEESFIQKALHKEKDPETNGFQEEAFGFQAEKEDRIAQEEHEAPPHAPHRRGNGDRAAPDFR